MKTEKSVLIIEDDQNIADLVSLHLSDHGFSVDHAADGVSGVEKAASGDFALVILDIMLPGMDGLEVCKRIRQQDSYIPMLMLTAKSEELDKVLGLELGADDYLTKPFSVRELIARIKAIFRRLEATKTHQVSETRKLAFPALSIDLDKRKVLLDHAVVELTTKEFDLLTLFASNPGRVYSRQQLLDLVWGYQFDGYEHTVNSHINRLRAKIEKDPSNPNFIKTVWGMGYRFAEPEEMTT